MKTQSIKSIATLLGVAVVLNVSALAGPGMQHLPSRRPNSSEQKILCVTAGKVRKTPTIALFVTKSGEPQKVAATIGLSVRAPAAKESAVNSRLTLTQVFGPHGVNYGYRRISTDR